jgi:hypothetical protein
MKPKSGVSRSEFKQKLLLEEKDLFLSDNNSIAIK